MEIMINLPCGARRRWGISPALAPVYGCSYEYIFKFFIGIQKKETSLGGGGVGGGGLSLTFLSCDSE